MVDHEFECCLQILKLLFDSAKVEPSLLYSHFLIKGHLDRNEVFTIKNAGNPSEQINAFLDRLKSKPKDEIIAELRTLAHKQNWIHIMEFFKDNFGDQFCKITEKVDKVPTEVGIIRENLTTNLKENVNIVFKYWDKMSISRLDKFDNFYNPNIVITDDYGKSLTNINSLEDLFKFDNFKRVVLYAEAGYGKSTFVHEMVNRWIKCDSNPTSPFALVFLFRLGEIQTSAENPLTLADLLSEKCLTVANVQLFQEYFERKLYSNVLFVFDGFDELQRELISDNLYNLIIGSSTYIPFVVVTCRPGDNLEKLRGVGNNVYMELNGFTETGIFEHLKRFQINTELYTADMIDENQGIKIPLFTTLYGIVQQQHGEIVSLKNNRCSLVDKMVKYLISRYRKNNPNFTNCTESELFCLLGRVAQEQFKILNSTSNGNLSCPSNASLNSLISNCHLMSDPVSQSIVIKKRSSDILPDFEISKNKTLLKVAIKANLVLPTSTTFEIFFPHRIFADYFLAYDWSHNLPSKIVRVEHDEVFVKFLDDVLSFSSTSWFSMFSSFFNPDFKTDLWKRVVLYSQTGTTVLPLFNTYEDLPRLEPNSLAIDFQALSPSMASSALKVLKFQKFITLYNFTLDEQISIVGKRIKLDKLKLYSCSVKCIANFLAIYGVEKLRFTNCKFHSYNSNSSTVNFRENKTVNKMKIVSPKGNISNFLIDVFKFCKNLTQFTVKDVSGDWIHTVKNKSISRAKIEFGNELYTANGIKEVLEILNFVSSSAKIKSVELFF